MGPRPTFSGIKESSSSESSSSDQFCRQIIGISLHNISLSISHVYLLKVQQTLLRFLLIFLQCVCMDMCSMCTQACYYVLSSARSSPPGVFCKKAILRNLAKFTGKRPCHRLFLIKLQASALQFIKKDSLAQLFSCEFCEISKNIFFTEQLRWLLLIGF